MVPKSTRPITGSFPQEIISHSILSLTLHIDYKKRQTIDCQIHGDTPESVVNKQTSRRRNVRIPRGVQRALHRPNSHTILRIQSKVPDRVYMKVERQERDRERERERKRERDGERQRDREEREKKRLRERERESERERERERTKERERE